MTNSARPIGFRQPDGTILPCEHASIGDAVGVSHKLLYILIDVASADCLAKHYLQENMHSSQLVPTYVSNGRLGPDNVSPNGWTSNSDVIVSDVAKDVQPTAKVQGKQNTS